MMMVSSQATLPFAVKTVASLTPIMVDGTGMCGACRVEVDGKTRFACVDGPDFDGHQINWDVLTMRLRQFLAEEDRSQNLWERENWHKMVSNPAKIPESSTSENPIKQQVEQVLHHGRCTTI
jgi:ferredoxin--NADP+ reductase